VTRCGASRQPHRRIIDYLRSTFIINSTAYTSSGPLTHDGTNGQTNTLGTTYQLQAAVNWELLSGKEQLAPALL
jgi:hypothetical protein